MQPRNYRTAIRPEIKTEPGAIMANGRLSPPPPPSDIAAAAASQPGPANSPAAFNGRLGALAAQRDQALNTCVMLTGELEHVREQLHVAELTLADLQKKLPKE